MRTVKFEDRKSTRLWYKAMTEKHVEILGRKPTKGDIATTEFIAKEMGKHGDGWCFKTLGDYEEYKKALAEEREADQKETDRRLKEGWIGEPYDIIAFVHEGNGGDFFSIGFRSDNNKDAWFEVVLGSHGEKNREWGGDYWSLEDVAEQRFATKEEVKRYIDGNEIFMRCIKRDGDKWKIDRFDYKRICEYEDMIHEYKRRDIESHMLKAGLWEQEKENKNNELLF